MVFNVRQMSNDRFNDGSQPNPQRVRRVAALTLGAKVSVPFWPVPMSMQVVALATLAMVLGMRHAVYTVLAYLIWRWVWLGCRCL